MWRTFGEQKLQIFVPWFLGKIAEKKSHEKSSTFSWPANFPGRILILEGQFFFVQFRVFQRRYSQNSKQTVQGRQWKGTNEQLSPVALFPLTAPNQEPAVDRPASPRPPNPRPEPEPGVGEGVWILGLNFGFDFFRNARFCRLAPSANNRTQESNPKIEHPFGKSAPKVALKTLRQKSAQQNPHQICSQNPR